LDESSSPKPGCPSWKSFPTAADAGFAKTCGIALASATDSEYAEMRRKPGNEEII
jgi:hypothetical protein